MVQVEQALCADCGGCVGACHVNCITILDRHLAIGASCDQCNVCVLVCPTGALTAEGGALRDWRRRGDPGPVPPPASAQPGKNI